MDGSPAADALAALRGAVDDLLRLGVSALPSAELTSLLAAVETERRRLEAVDQVLLAEIGERGAAGEYGRTGTTDLLTTVLRVSPAEARARVARARDIGPRRAMVGTPLPPLLPIVSAAVRAGEISGEHAGVITTCIEQVPGPIAHEAAPVVEQLLVEAARHEHPRALKRTAAQLLARLDPDGEAPVDRERHREFRLIKFSDGTSMPRGQFTPELTAMVDVMLDALAAPRPAEDGMPDDRTAGQRNHDAFAEALHRVLRSGTLPAAGGVPVTILATTTINELTAGVGSAVTGHGDPMSIPQLLGMACEAEVVPVIFNEAGGIMAFGRERRLASRGQRLALAARDGGCVFPGCDRPPAWTEVHHVRPWIEGGCSDIDNLCLLCRYHHRNFERLGWAIQMSDGAPSCVPPPWVDTERRPRRNTAQRRPDIEFSA